MPHALLNRLTAKPGQRQRVVEILLESGKLFDDNPACLLYLVSESTDDPNLVWVIDLWTSQKAHAEALKAPELGRLWSRPCRCLRACPSRSRSGRSVARGCQADALRLNFRLRLLAHALARRLGTGAPSPGFRK